ncbi:MAG: penicillin acylase family protein [Deltaproteobacteria bacterium]|uniref:Penicillin acylase family protein n=1 Tax=Candidatus Zymogenus saltonus TaxID=2844893 RepID=A0A9D8KDP2_9DELT|nr:penicillin acylase family protein [Candidatus Zymogenus saltonus]
MKIMDEEVKLRGVKGDVTIKRLDEGGSPRITAKWEIDLAYGLGYMHGHDRQVQLWLMKLIGWGRASETLDGSDELVAIDKYMRWIDMGGDAKKELKSLEFNAKKYIEAYCKGVNDAVKDTKKPFEFKMVGYKPDPWTPEDVVIIGRMIGFIGLTQSQGSVEKLIIEMIQKGISVPKIKDLFTNLTDKPTKEYLDILKKVKVDPPIIPPDVNWFSAVPSFHASNNWAVSPKKTASGKPILAGDPHLESNRLPSIWYEAEMVAGDVVMMGATLPGTPFLGVGRCRDIAWAVTFAFMDVVDYFIEEVKGGKYRRGNKWHDFTVREEIIRPKKKKPVTVKYYENDIGVLEGMPDEDGYYLNYAWSARRGCIAESLNSLLKVIKSKSVSEAMKLFENMYFAVFNWVCADRKGNIGYQMSGLFPKKADGTSGLLPYLAWDKKQHWGKPVSPKLFPSQYNPKEGFIATANEDANHLGKVKIQNMPMASYRRDRIAQILKDGKDLTVDDIKKMHYDTYSTQAERFMKVIGPLLPNKKNGRILKEWDLRYEVDSLGATLFERVYEELMNIVFGENGLGVDVVKYALTETGIFNDFYGFFDEVLLKKKSAWFGDMERDDIYKLAIERGLKKKAVRYGKVHSIMMTNLFFAGKLPKFLGFDQGPFELIGNRATIPQGQIFREAGRDTTFMPSYRMVCDMAEDTLHTNYPGGASDRRFSKYYKSDVEAYFTGKYKVLKFDR